VGDLVRDQCIVFYVDNELVAVRCLEWLQSSFDILINLFEWIGLRTNAEKTKVMTCLPGKIQVAKTEEEYASQQTGLGTSTTKRRRVDCKICVSLRLNPSKAIWRPSTTSYGRLYSTGISLLHACQWSTMLPNHPPPACTFARWHSVAGSWAVGHQV